MGPTEPQPKAEYKKGKRKKTVDKRMVVQRWSDKVKSEGM
jgi:hypothetical protein